MQADGFLSSRKNQVQLPQVRATWPLLHTQTRRAARNARVAAYARTTEQDRHAKSAKAEGFASTTNTEQFASSVLEAAYVHTVVSDVSARNAVAAKNASMAVKGAFCAVC
jgi:hypothetical protein